DGSRVNGRLNGFGAFLANGGTLLVRGAGQRLQQLAPQSGGTDLSVRNLATLSFTTVAPRAAGATLNFVDDGSGAKVQLDGAIPGLLAADGTLGGYATYGGVEWARYDAVAQRVVPLTAYSAGFTAGANVKPAASANVGTLSINTLNLAAANGSINVTQAAGSTLTLARSGVLKSGAFASTISGGNLTSAEGEVIFNVAP